MSEITIYDIAKEAGVSPATVSRVLTNNTPVSDKKRQVIENVIKKYNFTPNAAARNLGGGTRVIGLMVADIRNPYYASMAVECEKAANERGYTVLLCNMFLDQALEDNHLDKLYAQRVEAIIQIGRRTDYVLSDPVYAEHVKIISRVIPFITTGKLDGVDYYSVRINDAQSMKMVMDYLIFLGHTEIALIGGIKQVRSTFDKQNQYLEILKTHKLKFRKEFIQEGNYDYEAGYKLMTSLLKGKVRPGAVIAINDECAIGAIFAAQDHGLSVPNDISVIGFDNSLNSTMVRPLLTTVDCDYPLYGRTLVDTAIHAAQKKKPPREILLDSRLIVRESCASAGSLSGNNKE